MIELARVAMNAFTRATVTRRPFPTPKPSPVSAPKMRAGQIGMPAPTNALPAMTAENDAIAPIERSKPPAMNTSAPPQAMIPIGAA